MKNNEGQKTATRVLPGFLRRSLRTNYSDDQDEDESSSARQESLAEPPVLPRKEPPLEESKSETSTADETVTSSADLKSESPQLEESPKPELERTVSYKDSMFEKSIGADVVNMSDLRRLGWNGIPVRGL